jgi:hypothetical protein
MLPFATLESAGVARKTGTVTIRARVEIALNLKTKHDGCPRFSSVFEGRLLEAASRYMIVRMALHVLVLLAAPQFGERWARHGLDIARYSEDDVLVRTPAPDAIAMGN